MTAEIINGKKIAENIRNSVSDKIKSLEKIYGFKPNIATIKIGENEESNLYLKLRDKACEKVGIKSIHIELSDDISEKKVLEEISKLNSDDNIHGTLVQMPIPSHISKGKIFGILNPKKDVEGFTPFNMGNLLRGDENIIPCTPLAVLKILEHEKIDLKGKDVLIVNHSNVVGKPLCALFLNRDSSVSVTHVYTKDLKIYSKKADILVSAAGVSGLIKKEHVKPDSFVIDVGIVKTKKGVTGDIDFDSVKEIAGKITPVPGGVGPVTVACSLLNMVGTFNQVVKK